MSTALRTRSHHRTPRWRRATGHATGAAVRDDAGSVAAEVAIAVPLLVAVLLFAGVLVARGVDARLRVDDAAHEAARAASLTRSASAAQAAAQQTAAASLATAGIDCTNPSIVVDTADFTPGGIVTVTVSCRLDLSAAAALLAVGANRTVTATASSPIDTYRGTAVGLSHRSARRLPTWAGRHA